MRFTALLLLVALAASAQHNDVNYDEAKVPKYTLPDPLILQNGQPVRNAKTWNEKRRPELLTLFRTDMYGRRPGKPEHMTFELEAIDQRREELGVASRSALLARVIEVRVERAE